MSKYDLFRKITKSNISKTNKILNMMKYDILREFENSPSYKTVKINGSDKGVHWVDENSITRNPDKKRILSKPDESIDVGDIVYDSINYWLCTSNDTTAINTNGLIEKCNKLFKWTHGEYEEVQEEWGILFDQTRTGANISDGRYMVLGTNEFGIMFQNNENTIEIKRNKRLIFNDLAFKVANINFETIPGIVLISLKEDRINKTYDNKEEGIADETNPVKDEDKLW